MYDDNNICLDFSDVTLVYDENKKIKDLGNVTLKYDDNNIFSDFVTNSNFVVK